MNQQTGITDQYRIDSYIIIEIEQNDTEKEKDKFIANVIVISH